MKKRSKSISQLQKQRRQEKASIPSPQPVQPSIPARVAPARPIAPPAPTPGVGREVVDPALLLTVAQVCQLLSISRATLYRLEQAGKIPGRVQLMGHVRYHRPTLETWLVAQVKATGVSDEKP